MQLDRSRLPEMNLVGATTKGQRSQSKPPNFRSTERAARLDSAPRSHDRAIGWVTKMERDMCKAVSLHEARTEEVAATVPPEVQFIDVMKRFGSLVVLKGLNLSVARGEKVALIGPSGSGKTTLLRTLMTLEPINGGVIKVDGEPFTHENIDGRLVPAREAHLRRIRSKIGMVFQQFNLFPHMTALQNIIEAPVHVLGLSKDEATERAVSLLGKVGLVHRKDHYPAQLSGGQQQRVAIARALAMRPKILLFDEITSALDPELVHEVLQVMRQLGDEQDLTMLIVTHQMGFASEVADRVCFFSEGEIVEQGPPGMIFQAPTHERTRAFLRAVLEA